MTPGNRPDAIDALAAEYVLGTLRGRARRRFERWLGSMPLAQERVTFWEQHLVSLARVLRPIDPPARVWQGIRSRVGLARPQSRRRTGRSWAIAASVLLLVGLTALYWSEITGGRATEVAQIATPAGLRYWEVDINERTRRMVVHAGRLPALPRDRDYELWALPEGGTPVSLGVLPVTGTTRRTLTAGQQQALAASQQLAVTIEAAGGSATGKPTSKPAFVAALRKVG
jgi:anti-sigma-K factor RskA